MWEPCVCDRDSSYLSNCCSLRDQCCGPNNCRGCMKRCFSVGAVYWNRKQADHISTWGVCDTQWIQILCKFIYLLIRDLCACPPYNSINPLMCFIRVNSLLTFCHLPEITVTTKELKVGLQNQATTYWPHLTLKSKHGAPGRSHFCFEVRHNQSECLWENETKELYFKTHEVFIHRKINTNPHCKIRRRLSWLCGCFAASGSACLGSLQGTMKSEDFKITLEQNTLASVWKLRLSHESRVICDKKLQGSGFWS